MKKLYEYYIHFEGKDNPHNYAEIREYDLIAEDEKKYCIRANNGTLSLEDKSKLKKGNAGYMPKDRFFNDRSYFYADLISFTKDARAESKSVELLKKAIKEIIDIASSDDVGEITFKEMEK